MSSSHGPNFPSDQPELSVSEQALMDVNGLFAEGQPEDVWRPLSGANAPGLDMRMKNVFLVDESMAIYQLRDSKTQEIVETKVILIPKEGAVVNMKWGLENDEPGADEENEVTQALARAAGR